MIGDSSGASRIGSSSLFRLFRLNTGGAGVQNGISFRELGNTVNVLVSVVEVEVRRVAQALVPEETLGLGADGSNGSILLDVGMEREIVVFLRERLESITKLFVGFVLVLVNVVDGSTITFGGKFGIRGKGLVNGVEMSSSRMGRRKIRENKSIGIAFTVTEDTMDG